MESHDVVIVGAGLAGLQCARALAETGARVLLVDRRSSVTAAIHTTGIFVRRTLDDFAFPPGTLGPPVRHVTLYSPAGRSLSLVSSRDEFSVGRMDRVYAHWLAAAQRAGAAWRPATRYAGSAPERGGSATIVRLVSRRGVERVRARFLVGADGATSSVARDLDLDTGCERIVGVEDVYHDVPLEGPPRFRCFLDPDLAPGYLAWFVHDGEEAHLGVGGDPRRFAPTAALEAFRARVGPMVDWSRAVHVERRGGLIPVSGVRRRIASPHGLLVGDAAGAPSPLTAGGLDACLRLSTFAAEVIADHFGSVPMALSRYDGARFRARFTSRLWMRRAFARLTSRAALETGCALLRTPLLRPLASRVFFGRGSFPNGDARARPALLAFRGVTV